MAAESPRVDMGVHLLTGGGTGRAAGRRWWWQAPPHRCPPGPVAAILPRSDQPQAVVGHGRYNLLHECTAATTTRQCRRPEWWPVSRAGDDKPKEMGYLCKLPPCVKEVLFRRVTKILQDAMDTDDRNVDMYTRADIRRHLTKSKPNCRRRNWIDYSARNSWRMSSCGTSSPAWSSSTRALETKQGNMRAQLR